MMANTGNVAFAAAPLKKRIRELEDHVSELAKEAILRKTAIFKAQNDGRIIAELETSRDFHRNASSTRFALLQASKKRVSELEKRRHQAQLYILGCDDPDQVWDFLRDISQILEGEKL